MKNNKDCKIVQDLLPNYIENLTNEETNNFIEEHLKNCNECQIILENMKKDLQNNSNNFDKKEINFFKKYRKKMLTLKSIILIIVIIFVFVIGRKILIISSLSNKALESKNSNNYYVRYSQYDGDSINIIETYKKDDTQLTNSYYYNYKNFDNYNKWTEYKDGDKITTYLENSDGEKLAFPNSSEALLPPMLASYSHVYMDNIGVLLKNSIFSSVRTVNCNGIECYYFSNFQTSSMAVSNVGYGTYIDKKTGLPIRISGGTISTDNYTRDLIVEFDYKFDTVTDEDVKQPDITQYEIQEIPL